MRKWKHKRKRPGYVRPSRAAPKTGWSRRELAVLAGVSTRTIGLYSHERVMPKPKFRGAGTRYERVHLLSLLAIKRFRAQGGLKLSEIRTRLAAFNAPELEAFATEALPPGAVAQALGLTPSHPVPPATSPTTPTLIVGAAAPLGSRWIHQELALGLELNVREDASPAVLELARRIRELCGRP